MKRKRPRARSKFIVLVAVMALVVAGCANVRRGVAWPDLELVTINDDERVLVTFNDRIVAIDPYQGGQIVVAYDTNDEIIRDANGDVQQWNVELKLGGNNETFYVAPFRDGDNFIFPTYDSRFIEVDVLSGVVQSEDGIPLTDGVIADVIVTDELIYVPYRSGDVVALDAESYEEVWRFETEEGVWSSPILADGILYFGSIDHFLYAVDAQTGAMVWNTPVDLEGAIASSPLLDGDFLYLGSYSHKLYKINLDGVIVAEYEGNNWIWGTPVIDDGTLYYTDLNGYVYALNPDTMTEIWSARPVKRGIRSAPIVTDNFVVAAARNGFVYWLDRETGETVQEVEVERTPELLSDILYLPEDEEAGRPGLMLVASNDNRSLVTAINLDTFSLQWVYQQ